MLSILLIYLFLSCCPTACITETICSGWSWLSMHIHVSRPRFITAWHNIRKGYQCELCAQCSHIIKIHWLPLSEIQNVHCFGKQNVVRRSLAPLSGGLCLDCSLAWVINGTDQWFWSVILADGCQTAWEGGTKGEICHYHHLALLYEYFFLPWKRHPTRADNIKHMLCHICEYRETIIEEKL